MIDWSIGNIIWFLSSSMTVNWISCCGQRDDDVISALRNTNWLHRLTDQSTLTMIVSCSSSSSSDEFYCCSQSVKRSHSSSCATFSVLISVFFLVLLDVFCPWWATVHKEFPKAEKPEQSNNRVPSLFTGTMETSPDVKVTTEKLNMNWDERRLSVCRLPEERIPGGSASWRLYLGTGNSTPLC